MSLRTLDSFFGISQKRKRDEETDNSEKNSSEKNKENVPPAKKARDTWNAMWTKQFPWLEKLTDNDGKLKAVCSWCKKFGRTNSMATQGTPNLQSSTFSRHESTKDHLLAVQAHHATEKKVTAPILVETQIEQELDDESDSCKEAQFRTMYYVSKEGQPLHQYNNVITLQVLNKCPDLQDVSKLYTSEESKMEMLDAINVTIEESIDNDIRYSDYLGLIVDESTDITIHKKLCIYVKCLSYESKEPTIHFLDCIAVPDGKAETIVSEIEKLFQSKNIPWEKLSSLASDGAAVMIGRKSGVGVRLKEHSKNLVQVHCVAHKLALAAGQSCKDITLFNEYQLTLKQIYRFFSNSAVRYNGLRAMMEILEDEDMKYVTLKEPASFRWLSLEGAVKAVSDVYPALYSALENDAAKGNTEAKGLFLKVKSVGFVLVTAFLRDTLGCVGKLSRVFQKDDLDISVINTMVESTKEKLMLLKTNNGSELSKTYENIDDGQYRGVKILDKQQTRIGFQNASSDYLDKLNNNIEERFESDSMRTLNLLNVVLNPALVPKNSTLNEYGQAELSELGDIYCDFVDKDRMSDDYYQLKVVLKTMPADSSLRAACQHLISKYSDVFPDFVTLSKLLLVCPVTSVACERGFSSHNRIKTKGRGKLKHSTVTKLMRIMEEGPQLDKYDPKPAVKAFISSKKRRK